MASTFDYIFNVGGNFSATVSGMTQSTGQFTAAVQGAQKGLTALQSKLAVWDLASNYTQKFHNALKDLSTAGISLDQKMHELSAVAGVTGESLKQIEGFARDSAKTFGTDASEAVKGYQLLLSQLTPELGKYPEALKAMGDSIQTTSKLMGGDGVAAAQVLTTAMNQYGVSLEDPMAASEEMARMMNVMAAAGQAGSAELPAISAALQQCGMAAKAANVSFEETNAAIQVLDKAGKKASEGGVALRNVMGTLAKGRFLPKDVKEELKAAGININVLTDNSKSLHDRLETLKPVLNDDALLSKLFGTANANAARALIQGTDALAGFTDAVTGTNSAVDQAAIIMESYAERQARVKQRFEDMKISIFQATGDLTLWVETLTGALVPISQLLPLIEGLWKGLSLIKLINVKKIFTDMRNGANSAIVSMRNLVIGTYMTGISFGGFRAMAVTACRAVGTAIKSIPIVGWIAAGIAVVIEVVQILWDKCKGFRVVVFTALELFKRLGELLVQALQAAWEWVVELWNKTSEWVTKAIDWVVNAYNKVVEFFVGIWDKSVAFVTAAIDWIIGVYNKVVEFFAGIWAKILEGIEWIREKIAAFVDLVSSVFSAVYTTVVGFATSIWNKISSVVDKIRTKLANFLAPIVNACKQAYNSIKSWFGSLFTWIETKINSVIDWFIEIYNKIAAALGWDAIKARGKARADASWAKDHPGPATGNPASVEGGEVPAVTPAGATGSTDVTGGGLGKAGSGGHSSDGSSSDGGKIKNITINVDKLVETIQIHAASVGESAEQMKQAVLEALTGALNDSQLAVQ